MSTIEAITHDLTDIDVEHRREMVRQEIHNQRLEGGEIPPPTLEDFDAWARGDLTMEQVIARRLARR